MGGFQVSAQPFSVYQAIDWLCNKSATLQNQINASRRVREMLEKGEADDLVKLGIVSRLAELLERTYDLDLQVISTSSIFSRFLLPFFRRVK